MTIYLDLIFFLNFFFDFLLLLSVSILLRRNSKIIDLLLGSIVGSLSIFLLFIKLNSISLFFLKIIISILMILITFKYKNIKWTLLNLLYLYTSSIFLGGFLYFINLELSYKQIGLIFINKGISINFIFLIIFSPIIIYIYLKQGKKLKNQYANYYKVLLYNKNKTIPLTAYLDTGNQLIDPYFNKPIILINKGLVNLKKHKLVYIPYNGINGEGMLKGFYTKILIKNKKKKVLVGVLKKNILIDGINCLIQTKLLEGINENNN